jgi:exportin-2 (importin alpha re-exporter)
LTTDSDTRRRASADLVRGLLTLYEQQVTHICAGQISDSLAAYQKDPQNWRAKDTALYMLTSLSAKTLTAKSGATSTNDYIQILSVFAEHILPDLQAPAESNVHPVVKVDAIKFVTVFRYHVSRSLT